MSGFYNRGKMKFIHAADTHLGNPISGIDRKINLPEEVKKQIALATFTAFSNVIKLAVDRHVDFVLFPGDLFDSSQQSAYLYNFLNQQFQNLKEAGIEAFISFGNHDFQSDVENDFIWPENVHAFPKSKAKTFFHDSWDGKRVAITGTSFAVRNPQESLVPLYPSRDQSATYQIGMYHGSQGNSSANNYAPFSVGDLQALNYDYWALGHIHVRQVLSKNPAIVYSGDPQGLDLTETGEKGVYFVSDENDQGGLTAEFVPCSSFVFDSFELSINDQSAISNISDLIVQELLSLNHKKMSLNAIRVNLSASLPEKILDQLTDTSFLDLVNSKTIREKQFLIKMDLNVDQKKDNFNQLEERYWQAAKNDVFDEQSFNQALLRTFNSNQQFVIRHFTDPNVQAKLMSKAEQIISERIS
ncbi:metallophosphatase [Oenococcus oeni]|uniref:metallophosphoesterase family protein n=1 Tax=Oenococcus oeni TaxID=1247 RepID=UPI0004A1079E|nr:DNA repair exonuclease [Oenococcus oeni]KDE87082.1 metallophosphatase [Oenococcus oeni]OIL20751.1 metallophosphatase [Oenococcus oeni]OIL25704.1 metallophosphatase [Oenococcus oeni]OIL35676.1 metallophosphatase [Oenococcus oeni]OIL41828.1 metallophosphatase [Oenococcus oeni]